MKETRSLVNSSRAVTKKTVVREPVGTTRYILEGFRKKICSNIAETQICKGIIIYTLILNLHLFIKTTFGCFKCIVETYKRYSQLTNKSASCG